MEASLRSRPAWSLQWNARLVLAFLHQDYDSLKGSQNCLTQVRVIIQEVRVLATCTGIVLSVRDFLSSGMVRIYQNIRIWVMQPLFTYRDRTAVYYSCETS
jgi:hypothetical protein